MIPRQKEADKLLACAYLVLHLFEAMHDTIFPGTGASLLQRGKVRAAPKNIRGESVLRGKKVMFYLVVNFLKKNKTGGVI